MGRKYSYREEKTAEEIALEALQKRFRKDGYRARKSDMQLMDIACRKCGYLGYLYNVTYKNENQKRVLTACVHCGYESEVEQVGQLRMF